MDEKGNYAVWLLRHELQGKEEALVEMAHKRDEYIQECKRIVNSANDMREALMQLGKEGSK